MTVTRFNSRTDLTLIYRVVRVNAAVRVEGEKKKCQRKTPRRFPPQSNEHTLRFALRKICYNPRTEITKQPRIIIILMFSNGYLLFVIILLETIVNNNNNNKTEFREKNFLKTSAAN